MAYQGFDSMKTYEDTVFNFLFRLEIKELKVYWNLFIAKS